MKTRLASRFARLLCGLLLLCLLLLVPLWQTRRQQRLDDALFTALTARNTDAAIAALRQGADPNARLEPVGGSASRLQVLMARLTNEPVPLPGESALYYAVASHVYPGSHQPFQPGTKDARLVKALLEARADPNTGGPGNNTPLYAVANGNGTLEILQLLLQHGAQVNAGGSDGQTPLMLAASGHDLPRVKALLEAGADANLKNHVGYTAFSYSQPGPQIKALLLKYGADPHTQMFPAGVGVAGGTVVNQTPPSQIIYATSSPWGVKK